MQMRLFAEVHEVLLLAAGVIGQPLVELGEELILTGQDGKLFRDLLEYLLRKS